MGMHMAWPTFVRSMMCVCWVFVVSATTTVPMESERPVPRLSRILVGQIVVGLCTLFLSSIGARSCGPASRCAFACRPGHLERDRPRTGIVAQARPRSTMATDARAELAIKSRARELQACIRPTNARTPASNRHCCEAHYSDDHHRSHGALQMGYSWGAIRGTELQSERR